MEIVPETTLEEVISYMVGLGMTRKEAESMAPNWLRRGDQSSEDVRRGIIKSEEEEIINMNIMEQMFDFEILFSKNY